MSREASCPDGACRQQRLLTAVDAMHAGGREDVEQWVAKSLPDPTSLQGIICNEGFKNVIRAAAVMLYLLHPQRDLTLKAICEALLVKLYTNRPGRLVP